jgi:hypothetical protein
VSRPPLPITTCRAPDGRDRHANRDRLVRAPEPINCYRYTRDVAGCHAAASIGCGMSEVRTSAAVGHSAATGGLLHARAGPACGACPARDCLSSMRQGPAHLAVDVHHGMRPVRVKAVDPRPETAAAGGSVRLAG